jgi:hypothetical protein
MLVEDSRKHQPEFDLGEAQRVYTLGRYDKKIAGEDITGPFDLFCVETCQSAALVDEAQPIFPIVPNKDNHCMS